MFDLREGDLKVAKILWNIAIPLFLAAPVSRVGCLPQKPCLGSTQSPPRSPADMSLSWPSSRRLANHSRG